jgi:hypothetical protein
MKTYIVTYTQLVAIKVKVFAESKEAARALSDQGSLQNKLILDTEVLDVQEAA